MPGGYARKRHHDGHTRLRRRLRLRNKTKDLDQIDLDLKTNTDELLNQEVDLDKPGFAQNYCLHCAKYFIDARALSDHFKTKVHKRRMKALELNPYSHEEGEAAAGHGSFKALPVKRKIETQPTKDEYSAGKRVKVTEYTSEELAIMKITSEEKKKNANEEKRKKRKSLNSSANTTLDDSKMQE